MAITLGASLKQQDGPLQIAGYTLSQQLYIGRKTEVYRGVDVDQKPVVVKILSQAYPSFSDLTHFRNQYAIAKNLSIPGVLKPIALEPWKNGYAFIMEDFGGTSLNRYTLQQAADSNADNSNTADSDTSAALPIIDVLGIALQMADILHALSQQQVVHKDIKPANILIHPESKRIQLIDFSIASLLPKETQTIQAPTALEGTLAYLAPEQTGRMNRGIDYRTDFYGLGITLYELLTGTVPFVSSDPLEMIHAHMAQVATPPCAIDSAISPIVSQIVLKLMAKNAEDRYQSALGLKHDLEKCLYQLKEKGKVTAFELGEYDVSDRFLIPEKLYGREAEVQSLLAAFERASKGQTEITLVAGFSGIGKTAVINEVHKPITRKRGYFIKGKFDQFNRNVPFSAFLQAFRSLVNQLLGEDDVALSEWKDKILSAVGENAQVIIEVMPGLEQIVGPQPAVPDLSGAAAQNRFNRVFQKFVAVFTSPKHPLVMFLDDLQWADSASLKLLKLLTADSELTSLLVLGAYRDNEVFSAHPLMLTLDEIARQGSQISTLTLAPLSEADITRLVADTLLCSVEAAGALSQLVYQKTAGNPFFTVQFLQGLHEDRLITYNREARYWQSDLSQLKQLALTDDVVSFMVKRLQKLSAVTQEVLKLAACIGNRFTLETLAAVCDRPQEEVATDLWQALKEGLIIPENESYKLFLGDHNNQEGAVESVNNFTVTYCFLHDRVQQAAYSLIAEQDTQITHLKVGKRLLASISADQQREKIFEIVNQLNRGTTLIEESALREKLASLNLIAVRKAIASTAYAAASQYVDAALSLLKSDCWQSQYAIALESYALAVEVNCLNGQFEKMDEFAAILIEHSNNLMETIEARELQVRALIAQNRFNEAIESGLSTLALLNIDLPDDPTDSDVQTAIETVGAQVTAHGVENLLDLPPMQDPQRSAAATILMSLISASYKVTPRLFLLIILKGVEQSITYGHPDSIPYCYGGYATILSGILEDLDTGYTIADVGIKLAAKLDAKESMPKALFMAGSYVFHWKQSLSSVLELLKESYQTALDVGNFEFAGYGSSFYCWYSYFSGKNLTDLATEMESYRQVIIQLKHAPSLNFHSVFHQAVLNLTGDASNGSVSKGRAVEQLQGRVCQEQEMLAIAVEGDDKNLELAAYIYCNKLILSYLFGADSAVLMGLTAETEKYMGALPGSLLVRIFNFYSSLAYLSACKEATPEGTSQLLAKVEANQEKMNVWMSHAPMNCAHQYALVEAEKGRVLNQTLIAIEQYDEAIAQAKQNGFVQEEALANELAAKFYLDWGKENFAALYMQAAYYSYSHWSAKAKIDDLEQCYSHLLEPILTNTSQRETGLFNPLETIAAFVTPNETIHGIAQTHSASSRSSTTSVNNLLDFATVIKASQALSGQMELDQLLTQLIELMLRQSGGDRCAIILPDSEQKWHLRAIAKTGKIDLLSEPLAGNARLPVKLLHYVKNTRETVVINNLKTDLPVIDEYLNRSQPKSLLCLPLTSKGKLIGLLTLQNQSTSEVFTQESILILGFICTQAAISLENAKLYEQSQAHAQQIKDSQLQTVQNEKMASLGNLVAGVAHEINNPIGFLNGSVRNAQNYLQDLLEHVAVYQKHAPQLPAVQEHADDIDLEFLCEDFPKLLSSMQNANSRIKAISTSLRTFSRADTEHKVSASLHEGLDSTLLILKYRLKANENRPAIQVVKNYGELSAIDCFPGQLNQVFMNLLANAIDVFDEAAQTLSIETLKANPQIITVSTSVVNNNRIEISIRDNGKGMSAEIKERIFDHLFTTKAVGKGTGLGLAIAYQIITEAHGGSITVNSEPGKGTEFCIHLPTTAVSG